ncbi:DUF3164 family protein [Desulfovibrio sp. TomC]|uniref:DUF3164 family protein n=1 Tax=Desulfovibrio sp. TomC TaxID=1562888 RepID=UPI00057489DC|nr:DUF3164 family protein [Desulfovibrio sp. TomC]KHK02797.1 hypothetical protein NY78_1747 [Desulfovibrio sp. TomC]
MNATSIPEGYMQDGQGRLVPAKLVKDVDKTRDQLVREIAGKALALREAMRGFRDDAMGDVAAFVQLSAEQYGAKVGGNKGNVTLTSFDGAFKVQRHMAEHLTFDERLQAAKELIDECITEWTEGSRDELKALILGIDGRWWVTVGGSDLPVAVDTLLAADKRDV